MSPIYLYSVLIILLSVCSVNVSGNTRIIGGAEAPPVFGLFHASLQNLTGYHVCGGAIVSKLHIVTAGHCVYRANPEYIKVIVGTTIIGDADGMKHDVEAININHKFNFTSKVNDIAILKVLQPFDLNRVRVISLRKMNVVEGEIVFLSGFGALHVNGESSHHMNVLMVPVFNQETCQFAMRYTREVTNEMFCTFTQIGQGTCAGDSGSPIIKDNYLVGVVSWGIPCGVGFPDVHTRVAPFVEWIRKQIRNDVC